MTTNVNVINPLIHNSSFVITIFEFKKQVVQNFLKLKKISREGKTKGIKEIKRRQTQRQNCLFPFTSLKVFSTCKTLLHVYLDCKNFIPFVLFSFLIADVSHEKLM